MNICHHDRKLTGQLFFFSVHNLNFLTSKFGNNSLVFLERVEGWELLLQVPLLKKDKLVNICIFKHSRFKKQFQNTTFFLTWNLWKSPNDL